MLPHRRPLDSHARTNSQPVSVTSHYQLTPPGGNRRTRSTSTTMTTLRNVTLCALVAQFAMAQQFSCRDFYGIPFEGVHGVTANSYIPFNYILGPTPCQNNMFGYPIFWTKRYRGDGPVTTDYTPISSARTYDWVVFSHNLNYGQFRDVGQTRNYGFPSPTNGYAITNGDEDGIPYDCFLWNDSGYAYPYGIQSDLSFPYSTQGQAHLFGYAANPLEAQAAFITWDHRVAVDYSNLNYVTASANVTHSCFPGHIVKVNNKTIYNYVPPRSDQAYVFSCLTLQQNKIVGLQVPTQQVPCN